MPSEVVYSVEEAVAHFDRLSQEIAQQQGSEDDQSTSSITVLNFKMAKIYENLALEMEYKEQHADSHLLQVTRDGRSGTDDGKTYVGRCIEMKTVSDQDPNQATTNTSGRATEIKASSPSATDVSNVSSRSEELCSPAAEGEEKLAASGSDSTTDAIADTQTTSVDRAETSGGLPTEAPCSSSSGMSGRYRDIPGSCSVDCDLIPVHILDDSSQPSSSTANESPVTSEGAAMETSTTDSDNWSSEMSDSSSSDELSDGNELEHFLKILVANICREEISVTDQLLSAAFRLLEVHCRSVSAGTSRRGINQSDLHFVVLIEALSSSPCTTSNSNLSQYFGKFVNEVIHLMATSPSEEIAQTLQRIITASLLLVADSSVIVFDALKIVISSFVAKEIEYQGMPYLLRLLPIVWNRLSETQSLKSAENYVQHLLIPIYRSRRLFVAPKGEDEAIKSFIQRPEVYNSLLLRTSLWQALAYFTLQYPEVADVLVPSLCRMWDKHRHLKQRYSYGEIKDIQANILHYCKTRGVSETRFSIAKTKMDEAYIQFFNSNATDDQASAAQMKRMKSNLKSPSKPPAGAMEVDLK